MNRLLLLCLTAFVWYLASCTNKDKIPSGVLPKNKMEDVLWDMLQAERFTATFMKDSAKNSKTENFKLYAQVFSIHGITKEEFIKSYKFYMSRPDIARVMFDSLATKANRRREEMYKPKEPVPAPQPDTAKTQTVQPQTALPPVPVPVRPAITKPQSQPQRQRPSLKHLKKDSLLKRIQ